MIEFDKSKVVWRHLVEYGFPGYVRAIGAYIGHRYRWEEAPDEWILLKDAASKTGRNLGGRGGFFRFGQVSYMDRELSRRDCNGMTPEQIVARLDGLLPEVKLLDDGVLIVAANDFPEQAETFATDRVFRERLDCLIGHRRLKTC